MAQVLVRELPQEVVDRLKERARRHGRSLEAELRDILERATRVDRIEARDLALAIRQTLSGGKHTDSAELLAEDRDR